MTLIYRRPETRVATTDFDHFDRLFGDLFGTREEDRNWTPAIDVQEQENDYTLVAEVPGIDTESLDITVEDGVLSLTGEKKEEKTEESGDSQGNGARYYRRERRFGRFERTFRLPEEVDADNIRADFRHGVLTLTLPKKEVAKPRRIEVQG